MEEEKSVKTTYPITSHISTRNYSSYHDLKKKEAHRLHPDKDGWKDAFIEELWAYFNDYPKATHLAQFCKGSEYTYRKARHLVNYYPEIKEAWEDIKYQLADRRFQAFIGANDDFKNANNCWRDIHVYNEEFDGINRYHEALKAEAKAKAENKEGREITLKLKYVKETDEVQPCPTE